MLSGDRASVWEDDKVLETDGGGGCTIMYPMPLKMIKMLNLILNFICILLQARTKFCLRPL